MNNYDYLKFNEIACFDIFQYFNINFANLPLKHGLG